MLKVTPMFPKLFQSKQFKIHVLVQDSPKNLKYSIFPLVQYFFILSPLLNNLNLIHLTLSQSLHFLLFELMLFPKTPKLAWLCLIPSISYARC